MEQERIISISRYYGSLPGILKKYDRLARSDAFKGNTLKEWKEWKTQARERIWTLLGMEQMETCPLNAQVTEREEAEPGHPQGACADSGGARNLDAGVHSDSPKCRRAKRVLSGPTRTPGSGKIQRGGP